MVSNEKIAELKASGLWAVRNDNGGVGYGGCKWAAVGEWTECQDWDGLPTESNGLFGQGPDGWGHMLMGNRFCLVELDGTKIALRACVKAKRAKILAVGQDAMDILLQLCDGNFPGQLVLCGNKHINARGLKSVGCLYIGCGVTFYASDLEKAEDISVEKGAVISAPKIK